MSDDSEDSEVSRLIATIAADVGVQPDVIAEKAENAFGFDLTQCDESDAKEAREAWEAGDMDTFCEVLERYDVDEDKIREFRRLANQHKARADSDETVTPPSDTADDTADDTSNSTGAVDAGNAGGVGGGSGGLSEGEIRSIVRSEMQSAMQEVAQTQQPAVDGEAQDGQLQNQLALMLAQNFLGGGGGGGALAEQVQEEAMRSFIADLKRPDPSEVIADQILLKQYESMASEFTDGDVQLDGIGEYLQDKYGGDSEGEEA